ncbi:MAG: cytochrome c [Anaeromyxobacter sp.]|nr:cytochrome c [Anaeromyxobacter sp.]
MKRIATALALSFLLAGAASAADGKALFTTKCTVCHGPDGKGQSAMGKKLGVKDLTVTALTAPQIEAMIAKGKGKMTGFEGKLKADEIKAVATFVKGGLK